VEIAQLGEPLLAEAPLLPYASDIGRDDFEGIHPGDRRVTGGRPPGLLGPMLPPVPSAGRLRAPVGVAICSAAACGLVGVGAGCGSNNSPGNTQRSSQAQKPAVARGQGDATQVGPARAEELRARLQRAGYRVTAITQSAGSSANQYVSATAPNTAFDANQRGVSITVLVYGPLSDAQREEGTFAALSLEHPGRGAVRRVGRDLFVQTSDSGSATQHAVDRVATVAEGRPSPSATPAAQGPGLPGLGADESTFNATHVVQKAAVHSAGVSGADVSSTDEHHRVTGFLLNFNATPTLALAEAITRALAELPPDARVVRRASPGGCYDLAYESRMLAAVLGPGQAVAQFQSADPATLERSAITTVTLSYARTASEVITPCS